MKAASTNLTPTKPDLETDALNVPTLFPYKTTPDGLLVHVDFGFFRDLQTQWHLDDDDLVRIEATVDGIELTPVSGGTSKGTGAPYRIRLDGHEFAAYRNRQPLSPKILPKKTPAHEEAIIGAQGDENREQGGTPK